jgi:hypothetical protein
MTFQEAFNSAMALIFILVGWLLNMLYSSMCELSKADKDLATKVQSIEVLVAGKYIQRDEFEIKMSALFTKFDKLDEKIDRVLEKT